MSCCWVCWAWSARVRGARDRRRAGGPIGARAVRPGIEVLLADSAHLVRDRRVGLVTNQSGVDASGVSDVVRLRAAGVRLVALFSPEHGFRGAADPGAAVASSVDSATGLPIYSLYGRTSAPTDEMLAGIDVLLVDLQDAGARYYTYLTTTVDVMKAAGRQGHPGRACSTAPIRSAGRCRGTCSRTRTSPPVGRLRVPMRHGHDARRAGPPRPGRPRHRGGPARWCRSPAGAGRCRSTRPGLPFVPPSPNLRTLESLFHYPGHLPLRGHQPVGGAGVRCAVRADRRAVARHRGRARARCAAAALAGSARSRGVTLHAQRAGRREVRGYPARRASGSRSPTARRYDPTATAVHLLAAIRRRHPRPSSAGFRRTSTAWPGPPAPGGHRGGRRPGGHCPGLGSGAADVPRAEAAGAAVPGVNCCHPERSEDLPARRDPSLRSG